MPIVESEAFATTEELIERHMDIFQRRGFILVNQTFDKDRQVGPRLQFRFFNERTKLSLDAALTISTGPRKGIFMVLIVNSRNELLFVDNYLRQHGYTAEASLFVCTEEVPDFRNYVEGFLSMLDSVFDNQLKSILSGEKWESTPIDWQGYK